MQTPIQKAQTLFEKMFDQLEVVLGWETGYDSVNVSPVFIRQKAELNRLIFNPLCSQNLGRYLPELYRKSENPEKKIGICVKGCDSKSVIALMVEKFIPREKLFVVGFPCRGTIDLQKLTLHFPNVREIDSITLDDDKAKIHTQSGEAQLPLDKVLLRRCLRCRRPNPVLYDHLTGDPVPARIADTQGYSDVRELEKRELSGRLDFWKRELDRCIRCYACRNACPLCVCQDSCIAETRVPKWVSQENKLSEKFFFHMIHAFHLAGRCTECGECERVCPMGITVTLMKEKLNLVIKEMLDFEAGIDPDTIPPLMTYKTEETGF